MNVPSRSMPPSWTTSALGKPRPCSWFHVENAWGVTEFQAALSKTIDLLLAAKVSVFLMKEAPTYTFNVNKTPVRLSYKGADTAQLGLSVAEYEAAENCRQLCCNNSKREGSQ